MKLLTKNLSGTFRVPLAMVLFFTAAGLGASANAQTLEGKWVADWRVLDNGENARLFLDLHQDGAKITGTATTIGHRYKADGTLTATHIELSFSGGGNPRKLAGDIVGNELHLKYEGAALVARPAKPGDEYPPYEKVALPSPERRSLQRAGEDSADGVEQLEQIPK